jgi:ATP-dependent DNA helicase RecG
MHTFESIKSIISDGEGHSVEFKTSFSQEVIIALNAFANSDGGTVLVGVDNDGRITGVTLNSESIVSWINEIRSKTEPAIIPDAEEFTVDGKTVVALSVREFPVKPVAVKGRYYKRVKNSNHQLGLNEISDMYLKTFNSSWDYYIDEQHTLDDISLDKIIAFLEKSVALSGEEDPLRLLQKYELTRNGRITKAAYLLFVKDFTALTGIQAGRFKSATKIIDSVSLHSDLFTEVEQVLAFVRKHFMVEYIITGHAQREERYDYPEEAIREIVLNMIVHRDYRDSGDSIIKIFDDRIEFFNPGNLSEGLTVERLLSDKYTPKSRNKLINLIFKEAGLVEKYGSGIRRVVRDCRKHGKCKVEFFNEQHGFKVIVSKKNLQVNDGQIDETDGAIDETGAQIEQTGGANDAPTPPITPLITPSITPLITLSITELEKKLLEVISQTPAGTRKEFAETLGISAEVVKEYIENLKNKGLLQRTGNNRTGYWIITNNSVTNI